MAALIFGRGLFDELSDRARASARLRANLDFHPSPDFPAHRFLIAMEPGTYVRPHRHLGAQKDETLVALRGRFGLLLFDAHGQVTTKAILGPGAEYSGIDIPRGTFHSAVALESGSVIMEAKAGPYVKSTDKDWAAWAPAEDGTGAEDYLRVMGGHFS
jgi:cupin fold WbuC family metalloprotein